MSFDDYYAADGNDDKDADAQTLLFVFLFSSCY